MVRGAGKEMRGERGSVCECAKQTIPYNSGGTFFFDSAVCGAE